MSVYVMADVYSAVVDIGVSAPTEKVLREHKMTTLAMNG